MSRVEKPDVLLLYPKTGMDFGSTIAPPHAVLAVAAPLEQAGYTVAIRDQRVDDVSDEELSSLLTEATVCVGISTMTGTQIRNALFLAEKVRRLTGGKIPIVWGGTHPTILPEQTVASPLVDIVVVGEGEYTFLELVTALKNKTPLGDIMGLCYKDNGFPVRTPARPLMDVEDLLPVPWHLVDVENYIHEDMYVQGRYRVLDIGQTSRGCPGQCSFCSSASIRGRKWRAMSAGKASEMIIGTVKKFNLDGFWLRDDEFYINRKRADDICKEIINSGIDVSFYTSGTRVDVFIKATDEQLTNLKRAGAHTLKFGAESGSQRILNLMHKGITPEQTLEANRRCKAAGITPAFALIVGYPTETFEEMNQTISLGYKLKEDNPDAQLETMAQFTPLPGTPSFETAMQYDLKPPTTLEGWSDWLFDDYDTAGTKLPWLGKKERIWVGNISYMSIMANALQNALYSMKSDPLMRFFGLFATPASAYFRFRLKNHLYKFAPELRLLRYLRRKLFYESERTFHDKAHKNPTAA